MGNEIISLTLSMERSWGYNSREGQYPKVWKFSLGETRVYNLDQAKAMVELFFKQLEEIRSTNPEWMIS